MEENKSLEEMEAKSAEVVAELKEKAESELADAKRIEFGNSKEDVEKFNDFKSRLTQQLETIKKMKVDYITSYEKDMPKFNLLYKFLQNGVDGNCATNKELADILKEQVNSIDGIISDADKKLAQFDKQIESIENVLKLLEFKICEDGKAYIDETVLTFVKLA